jgi:3-isopropylmalate/(R)-2-methylmalate dehydratase small subunit
MKVTGKVWKFSQDDINTDQIRLQIYSHLPVAEQARHCLESLDPEFGAKAQPGDILVAGQNFGCGSSRPAHAALKALGISAVIAESFGRLFFRSSISDALLVMPCPGIVNVVNTGERIEVDVVAGAVRNLESGKLLKCDPLPPFLREMVECGGEMPYLAFRIARDRAARGEPAQASLPSSS